MDWIVLLVVLCWPIAFVVVAWWRSRGTASDEEITQHRLRDHHHFDPVTGDPIGWNRAKGDLVGLVFVLLAVLAVVIGIVAMIYICMRILT